MIDYSTLHKQHLITCACEAPTVRIVCEPKRTEAPLSRVKPPALPLLGAIYASRRVLLVLWRERVGKLDDVSELLALIYTIHPPPWKYTRRVRLSIPKCGHTYTVLSLRYVSHFLCDKVKTNKTLRLVVLVSTMESMFSVMMHWSV